MRIASLLVRLRWPIVVFWIAAAAVCATLLPAIKDADSGALGALVPRNAQAVKTEVTSKTKFGFPLLSRTLIVERNPHGLSAARQLAVFRRAAALTRHEVRGYGQIAAALPVTNAIGAAPFVRERSTTTITYLFFAPDVSVDTRAHLAERFVKYHVPPEAGTTVGVTGQAVAAGRQRALVKNRLPIIELATVLLVGLAVGFRFRAPGPPLVTLMAVAIAYLIASHLVALVGRQAGFAVPQEVEPVIVVLLFGVVTDYSIFYLSRFGSLLGAGGERLAAARTTTAQMSPIILVAGITVIAGTASLLAAQLEFLRVFGPGLAASVLVGVLVATTFVPACLAILGRRLFWPRRPGEGRATVLSDSPGPAPPGPPPRRSRAVRLACERPRWAVTGCLVVLALGASGLTTLKLANPIVRGLPRGSEPRHTYAVAARGFAPGMLSPTVVVVSGRGIVRRRAALARLGRALERQPGVALAVGPRLNPVPGVRFGATLSRDGNAARYFVVLRDDPVGARAIAAVRGIERRLPGLLDTAGLSGAQASLAGDTALSAETIDKTLGDLARIAPLALLAILLVLSLYLRAVVAPLYLVGVSVLGFAASLGVSAYVFGEMTYYVPFTVAVLLVALGSDYNVFLVGRVWQEARRRPLEEAIPVTATRATRAITLAGLVLASSFALMAIVPIRAFREIAFVMTFGLLLDTLLLRTVLVPALMVLVGRRSGWPGSALRRSTDHVHAERSPA
ncbi:MMPL family transporter [Paraconexibacter antarcticus]|uniref:MMPL family transporter n=1 Tax=Paraconexibacter antarcticus TaxID=2949664 RepID=A0ABY5DQ61_9ACTN|nr:MMPL family transporter [Paraconexibacter antarcticus]UTI63031.1 MMPL family transporter [Paraconexibacter antarcticus]